ncbi:hypothetical protein GGX14DRAFT_356277 [Mycena pura]|uniref:JmjC domain-containing protein n=1 Tax=Mycena pura TaxID=153505 RepID=A0AAD6VTD0_9AGAR|nr:hypothetical protein GGX14DRAFT_356277 [Mycena pura]
MKDRKSRRKPAPKVPAFVSCKGWSLDTLVAKSKNFHKVHRVRWSKSTAEQIKEYDAANRGKPLIVEGLHEHPKWITAEFTPEWLLEHSGSQEISARNVHDRTDKALLLSDFIKNARATSHFVTPGEKERLYGKDVPCPSEWKKFLHTGAVIPASLAPDGPDNVLNNLPKADRPETLMCYLGIGDTFTPYLCASYGHNLMTYTENGGSSFWFMTETSSANAAAEFFHSVLEQELDHESHVVLLDELAKAPFNVYIAEQKLGDLILVPPRSAHQVVNSGGLTIKTSWSRMTVDSLTLALRYELPLYRRVCRIETYRVKSTIYHTLRRVIRQGKRNRDGRESPAGSPNVNAKEMASILDTLLRLFDSTLKEEYTQEHKDIPTLSEVDKEDDCDIGQLACNFCGCDLFQSFFECTTCVKAVGQKRVARGAGFNICPGCYAEGRSCHCEVMSPVQCRSPADLLKTRKQGIALLAQLKGGKSGLGLPSEKYVWLRSSLPPIHRLQGSCWQTAG